MVMDSGCAAIVNVYACEAKTCWMSVTRIVKLKVPLVTGVPVSVPLATSVSPAGRGVTAAHV